MSMPDECKWCGCDKVLPATIGSLYFGCLTRYCSYDGEWYISDTCAASTARQMPDLRKRIADAVKALETISRYKIEAVYDFGAIGKPDKIGDWVHFEDLEPVIEILTGSYPETPDDLGKRENEQ